MRWSFPYYSALGLRRAYFALLDANNRTLSPYVHVALSSPSLRFY